MKKILSSFLVFLTFVTFALPSFADASDNFLTVNKNSRHLHSRLSKHYVGYEYIIKNKSKDPVEITAMSLTDNVTGEAAYLSIRRTGLAASTAVLTTGVALALPTLSLSLIASAVAVPFILVGNVFGNIGAKQDSKRYSKDLNENILQPKDTVKFTTLAKRFSSAKLKIIYKSPLTGELVELDVK